MKNEFEVARKKYRPSEIKYLLIAESPPQKGSGRFFYFEDVTEHDALFLETMKVLYPSEYTDTKYVRRNKANFLRKFMIDGFYLIDSTDIPIIDKSKRHKEIEQALPDLCRKVREISGIKTKIILVSRGVYDVCFNRLKSEGFNVVNTEMIDHPSSGGQTKYRNKIGKLLKSV
ncbi:MAG: hypothetical protein WBX49_12195 [Candidatus Deferrimicrobiaceae bacterium]